MIRTLLLASTALLGACAITPQGEPMLAPPVADVAPVAEVAPVAPAARNAELARFFADYDKAELALSPLAKSYRAIKDEAYGELDQLTDAWVAS